MVGVITVFQGDLARVEEGKRALQEHIIPALKAHKGFKRGSWLLNTKTGEVHAISIWEDEAALKEGMATLQQVRDQSASMGLTLKSTQTLEVVGIA
jgi:quinol monooxygenase YgiN